jgi:hypothetical protein
MLGLHLVDALMLNCCCKNDKNVFLQIFLVAFFRACCINYFVFAFSGSEDQKLLVEESINHAKEAVMLDIKDGNCWCKSPFVLFLLPMFLLFSISLFF